MNLIEKGLEKGLIKFDENKKYITYLKQNKQRNYNNPEEQIQLETYLKLILIYDYSPQRILQFVSVTMGSTTKEADIIVYNDDLYQAPYIVIECKKQDISELEFKQAVEQGFSYAVAEGAKYVWVTSGLKNEYFEVPIERPKAHIYIPDIPQFGVTKLAKFKYAKNGGEVNGQKLFELEIVTEDGLTRRFKQAHNALWGGGELNPSMAFDELDKLIFCKIWDEKKPRKKGEAYDFQIFRETDEEKTNQELMKRVISLYNEGRKRDPEVFKDDIRLSAEKLRTVVGYLEGINLGETDLDSKGRAFETFMGSFFRGDFGQYFTPRNIVKFIIDVLPINNDSLVLDTSCGSGGFLLHTLDKIRQQADEYYQKNTIEHYKYWHDFAEKNLYGIEINEQIARTAKMNMIIHDDGDTNVISADGLLPSEEIMNRTNNQGFANNRFDFITTNPPFGSIVKQTEQAYMKNYNFAMKEVDWLNSKSKLSERENQNTEILFIEQCYNFLREGGYLAIVIPDGILTNSSLQYVRDWLEEKYRIVAVISLPQTAFSATGAGVKSSVLFLKKYDFATTEKIQQQKLVLQNQLKNQHNYEKLLTKLEKEKKDHLKKLIGFENVDHLTGKDLEKSEAFKEWKKEVNNEYRDKIEEIKANLLEEYSTEKQRLINDYEIFMAMAEDIGYDATGKPTNNNELELIAEELTRFIANIEKGEDSFFLSENVDINKIFLVKLSELNGRLDPHFHKPIFKNIYQKIQSCQWDTFKLKELFDISRGGSPRPIQNYLTEDNNGVNWLKIGDTKEVDKYIYETKQKIKIEGAKFSRKVIDGDLILSNSMSFGKPFIMKTTAYIHDGWLLFRGITDKASNDYYHIILGLSFIYQLFKQQTIGSVVENLNIDLVKDIIIPIPPLEIQNQIVTIMDNAYNSKKPKETEAQKLLESIDNYLLRELGIELPKQSENTVTNRIFYRKLSEISGGRFDPDYFKIFYTNLENAVKKGIFTCKTLEEITTLISNGTTPASNLYSEEITAYPIIKAGSYEGDFISFRKIAFTKSKYLKQTQKNDLFILSAAHQADYVGRSIKYLNDLPPENTSFVGELICIRANPDFCNSMYLFSLLNTELYKNLLNREKTGQTSHIYPKDIKNINVPIPPLEKQKEIATNITQIREEAKQLKEEAKTQLELAKIEVEKMILGEL